MEKYFEIFKLQNSDECLYRSKWDDLIYPQKRAESITKALDEGVLYQLYCALCQRKYYFGTRQLYCVPCKPKNVLNSNDEILFAAKIPLGLKDQFKSTCLTLGIPIKSGFTTALEHWIDTVTPDSEFEVLKDSPNAG